jgi:hypothetical protein
MEWVINRDGDIFPISKKTSKGIYDTGVDILIPLVGCEANTT